MCRQVGFLKQLKRETPEEDEAYLALEKDLLQQHPKHLPLLSARLASTNSLSSESHPKKLEVSSFVHMLLFAEKAITCTVHFLFQNVIVYVPVPNGIPNKLFSSCTLQHSIYVLCAAKPEPCPVRDGRNV